MPQIDRSARAQRTKYVSLGLSWQDGVYPELRIQKR